MTDGTQPAVFISGMPADTFSTLQRDVARGRLFSERFSPEQALVFDPETRQIFRVTSIPGAAAAAAVIRFVLDGQRFPRNLLTVPGGPAFGAQGLVEVRATAGIQAARVVARVSGLGPLPAGTVLTVWLLHDVVVPANLDPADLAALPRLAPGVNQPGQVFTVDGQPSTVGRADVAVWNTVTVAIRAGALTAGADGAATLDVPLTADANVTLDPRLLLGPQLGTELAASMPSGITAAIMTDVFLRPVTVLPELPLATAVTQRLAAVAQAAVTRFDTDGDGIISAAEAQAVAGAFLQTADFSRVAVTVEPVARQTPLLLPTDQAVVLVGLDPTPA